MINLTTVRWCLFLVPILAWAGSSTPNGEWLEGRLIVNFDERIGDVQSAAFTDGALSLKNADVDALLNRFEVSAIARIVPDAVLHKMPVPSDSRRLVLIHFPEKFDVLEVMDAFRKLDVVTDAEPDLLLRTFDNVPNDQSWNQQWDKRQMNCPTAWDFGQGSRDILAVAVDGGFYWSHDDAFDNLWVNPGEDLDGDRVPYSFDDYPGDIDDLNGVDDDGNGYVDDLIGWDFVDNITGGEPGEDTDEQDNDTYSVSNHGTHVLGLIGARGNNSLGVAGVCWNLQVMASRAGYDPANGDGVVVQSAAIATINWAVAHGVKIINMSYGGPSFSNPVNNTIQAAWASGALLCGASGNDGSTQPQYPADYANVISVGSVDNGDAVSSFSNRGAWVECYAPGGGVYSLSLNDVYTNLQGTSMASPNAAGLFALIWSIFPDLNNGQLRDLVLQNCANIAAANPGIDPDYLGWGRVDAEKTLASLLPNLTVENAIISGDNDGDGRLEANENAQLELLVSNAADWFEASGVSVNVTSDDPNLTLSNANYAITSLPGGQSQTLTNPNATISCGASVPWAYTTTLRVEFRIPGNVNLVRNVTMRVGRAPTLVVDDDNGANFAAFYSAALLAGGYNYDDFSTSLDGSINAQALSHYDNVVWATGNEQSNTLTQSDRDLLIGFLNGGGNLLLAGQGIDEDTEVRNSSFYADYLHVQSGGASGSPQITGVSGDAVSDNTNLILIGGGCGGNGNVSPSALSPTNGGIGFYTYNNNGLVGAVRFANDTYRVAYFGFALEAACGSVGSTHHREVVRRVMNWFGAVSDADDSPAQLPADFTVSQAYPNPFNPDAHVTLDLPRESWVRMTLHDILGRQVQTILNQPVAAGTHSVRIDGSSLASGSYWLNVTANNGSRTQRLILLK